VRKRRHGREQRVSCRPEAIEHAQRVLADYERLWRDRFDRMATILDGEGADA
jgi:hypothetical protein